MNIDMFGNIDLDSHIQDSFFNKELTVKSDKKLEFDSIYIDQILERKVIFKIKDKVVCLKGSKLDVNSNKKLKMQELLDISIKELESKNSSSNNVHKYDNSIKENNNTNNKDNCVNLPVQKVKINLGSLIKLYTSDLFTNDLLLYHLHTKSNPNICKFLINKLYSLKNTSFFIPQFVNMFMYHVCADEFREFLLEMCVNKMNFALKLYWITVANYEDNKNNSDILSFLLSIEEKIVKNDSKISQNKDNIDINNFLFNRSVLKKDYKNMDNISEKKSEIKTIPKYKKSTKSSALTFNKNKNNEHNSKFIN